MEEGGEESKDKEKTRIYPGEEKYEKRIKDERGEGEIQQKREKKHEK